MRQQIRSSPPGAARGRGPEAEAEVESDAMQPMIVPAGATVFRTGDPSLAVYVIEDGEVAISVGEAPASIEVARLHAGALFGESGVLEFRARAATATAVTVTTLLVTDAETFVHAFGMENDRALSLVRLLCSRLRGANERVVKPGQATLAPAASAQAGASIQLLPDHERLISEYAMKPLGVRHLPFQVGNRFGGEIIPFGSNHCFCIPARGEIELAAPHFELLRRGGVLGVRDLGSRDGTIVNGVVLNRGSREPFVPLHKDDNEVIAGRPKSPFRFRVRVTGAPSAGT